MAARPVDPDVLEDLAAEPDQRGGERVDLDVEGQDDGPVRLAARRAATAGRACRATLARPSATRPPATSSPMSPRIALRVRPVRATSPDRDSGPAAWSSRTIELEVRPPDRLAAQPGLVRREVTRVCVPPAQISGRLYHDAGGVRLRLARTRPTRSRSRLSRERSDAWTIADRARRPSRLGDPRAGPDRAPDRSGARRQPARRAARRRRPRRGARPGLRRASRTAPPSTPTFDALLADPAIDVVYIALPNGLHAEWTIRALDAGKHVLCEKPLALTAADVDAIAAAAERNDRIAVEAFMYLHHPQTLARARDRRGPATLGRAPGGQRRRSRSSSTGRTTRGSTRTMGGGSLWDVGCYPVSIARRIAGEEPDGIAGVRPVRRARRRSHVRRPAPLPERPARPFRERLRGAGSRAGRGRRERRRPSSSTTRSCPSRTARRRVADDPARRGREDVAVESVDQYRLEVDDLQAAILDGTPPRVDLAFSRGGIATLAELDAAARQADARSAPARRPFASRWMTAADDGVRSPRRRRSVGRSPSVVLIAVAAGVGIAAGGSSRAAGSRRQAAGRRGSSRRRRRPGSPTPTTVRSRTSRAAASRSSTATATAGPTCTSPAGATPAALYRNDEPGRRRAPVHARSRARRPT